jgi:hypothetical protein
VSLSIIDINGSAIDITPHVGWYDEDHIAVDDTPIPNLNIFDFQHIRLRYTSTNWWYFDKMSVRLSYAPDPLINNILRPGQLSWDPQAWSQVIHTWDLVLQDEADGWVNEYDEWTYEPRDGSSMAQVRDEMGQLHSHLNWADEQITTVMPDNVIHVRFDELVDLLEKTTQAALNGEPGMARSHLSHVLEILEPVRAKVQKTGDERQLLFAIELMLSDTYIAQRTFPQAYQHLIQAYADLPPEDADYLWLKLAALFQEWGDSLFAQAGRDYAQRLAAVRMYQKVASPSLALAYDDGCEHEVSSLWIDLGPVTAADVSRIDAWAKSMSVGLWRPGIGTPPIVHSGLPIRSVAIVPATPTRSPPAAREGFLRIELDVSEQLLTREGIRLAVTNRAARAAQWRPKWLRWHVGYQVLLPVEHRSANAYRGFDRNIRSGLVAVGEPSVAGTGPERMAIWAHDLQVGGSWQTRAEVERPSTCAATLLFEQARLRLDSIRNHLNYLGIHDEYVPAHRFKALYDNALRLAERATVLESRYIQFKDRAETETLNQADAAHLIELAAASRETAQERLRDAELGRSMADSQVSAGRTVLTDAQSASGLFAQTYRTGIQQFADQFTFGLSLGGPSIGVSVGGLASTLAGQGYEDVFRLQKFEYEAKVRQAEGMLRQLDFARSIAEVEVLVARKTLELEQFRERLATDRVQFLAVRDMNASHWYRMAAIYKGLLDQVTQSAARWAWLAERALEFEINHRVDLIRMDYHTMPLGSERLMGDIDSLQSRLLQFRERYRDVPNIIEREFHFSRDFHEAFRALTSPATPSESHGAAEGLRRVQFTTKLDEYDVKIPGRYAFARVFGVEMEIQADVGTGLVTGYLENARLVPSRDGLWQRLSTSLVRVPKPMTIDNEDTCPILDDLDSSIPSNPWDKIKLDEGLDAFIEGLVDWMLGSSSAASPTLKPKPQPEPRPQPVASLLRRAHRNGLGGEELRIVGNAALGDDANRAVEAVNAYAVARGVGFRLRPADLAALQKLSEGRIVTPEWYIDQLIRQIKFAGQRTWELRREGWSAANDVVVYKDLTPRYGKDDTEAAKNWVDDYVDYTGQASEYVLRVKRHEVDCLTLSTYRREQDAQVFNPYESYDLLGIFGNCGIHMDWTLTLRAWTDDRPDPIPVYDRIREIILRVWYHAAYERGEGPALADAIQRSVMRLGRRTLDISAYRDLYDEFATLVGDFDPAEPAALDVVREFTDRSSADQGGWLPFDIDASLAPFDDHRIAGMACVVTSFDPQAMPDLAFALRRGESGPVYRGRSRTSLADAVRALSAPAPAGFGGLNPRGRWYFRLAAADNPGASLALLQDIQIYMEFALPGDTS